MVSEQTEERRGEERRGEERRGEERRGEERRGSPSGGQVKWSDREIWGHFVQDGMATAVATTGSSLYSDADTLHMFWGCYWSKWTCKKYKYMFSVCVFACVCVYVCVCVWLFAYTHTHTKWDSEKWWLSQQCRRAHTSHLPNEINHNLEL